MAGRSGAAAIEVALGEAAAAFDPRALADAIRRSSLPDGEALATGLEGVQSIRPCIKPKDGECYLEYGAVDAGAAARRVDCAQACPSASHGVEVHLVGTAVVGVSLYLV